MECSTLLDPALSPLTPFSTSAAGGTWAVTRTQRVMSCHPSIRIAATRVSVPMLNIDKAEAVRLFLSLNSHPNDEVLRGHELSEFLGYALIGHFDELRPILERM